MLGEGHVMWENGERDEGVGVRWLWSLDQVKNSTDGTGRMWNRQGSFQMVFFSLFIMLLSVYPPSSPCRKRFDSI